MKKQYKKLTDAEKAEQIKQREAVVVSILKRIKAAEIPSYIGISIKEPGCSDMRKHCNIDIIYEGSKPLKLKSHMVSKSRVRELNKQGWIAKHSNTQSAVDRVRQSASGDYLVGTIRNRKRSRYDFMPRRLVEYSSVLYDTSTKELCLFMFDQQFSIPCRRLSEDDGGADIFAIRGDWYLEQNLPSWDLSNLSDLIPQP